MTTDAQHGDADAIKVGGEFGESDGVLKRWWVIVEGWIFIIG